MRRAPSGATPEYQADFAADGIDELIMGFGRRRKYQPGSDPRTADGGLLRVLAADTGDAWSIEAHEGRLQPRRDADGDTPDGAGCTVSGPASSLYLYLWNRADAARAGVTVAGDPALLAVLAGQRPRPLGLTRPAHAYPAKHCPSIVRSPCYRPIHVRCRCAKLDPLRPCP